MDNKPKQILLTEDEHLIAVTQIKTVSPFTPFGVTMVQAHVSPMENLRVTGAPRVDVQYELSDYDEGVPIEPVIPM